MMVSKFEPARREAYELMDMPNFAFIGYSFRRFCLAAIIWTPDIGVLRQ
jgi:hypothetical protein